MPIYEFYCPGCNKIFDFFSRSSSNRRQPLCPKCRADNMRRLVSRFATTRGRGEAPDAEGGKTPVEDARIERTVETLASESDLLTNEDPRSAAQLMRKLSGMTGMKLGDGMREALERIEAGEDPDAIERDMGDRLEEEDPLLPDSDSEQPTRPRRPEPERDETLYDL